MIKDYIRIFTGGSILINRLSFLLDEAKIHSIINDKAESTRLGGQASFQNSVELFIYKSDVEKATPIIENFKKEIAQ